MATFEVENGRLYQWDIGRTIKVSPEMGEAIDEVHFAYGTDEDALRRELYDGKAEIPNVLLQRHGQMRVWAVVNDEDGRQTIQNAYLNVRERNKPEDYIYTDEEVRRYEELEARLDEETGKYNEVDERLDRLENDKNYVISVNGKTGKVKLVAADVGAVESVNGENGKVILSAEDVGALPVNNGNISIGKTTSTTSNSFTLNRRYDSITTQTAKFGIAGEELSISMSEKVTPASGGTHTTTGTISVSPRKTSFTTPLYFTSAPVKSRTRENLDIYSKEEVDEAILEATKNNGDEEAVKIVPQELSTDQQEQARNNIDVYSKTEVDDIIEELEIDKAVESVNGMTGEVVLTAADVGAFPSTGGKVSGSVTATGTLIAGQGNTYTARLASASNMAMLSAVNKSGSMVNSIQLYSDRTMLNQPLAVSSGGHGGKNAAEGRKNLEVDSSTEVDDKIAAQVGQITPATIGAIADQDGIIRERHLGAQVVKNGNIAYGAVSDSRIAEKTITFQRLSDACVEDIKAAALPTASADVKGGVKIGDGLTVKEDGTAGVDPQKHYTKAEIDAAIEEATKENEWELIETIVCDETYSAIKRTTLSLCEMELFITTPAADTAVSAACEVSNNAFFGYAWLSNAVNTGVRYTYIHAVSMGGRAYIESVVSQERRIAAGLSRSAAKFEGTTPIKSFSFYLSNGANIPKDTVVEIWGVRA